MPFGPPWQFGLGPGRWGHGRASYSSAPVPQFFLGSTLPLGPGDGVRVLMCCLAVWPWVRTPKTVPRLGARQGWCSIICHPPPPKKNPSAYQVWVLRALWARAGPGRLLDHPGQVLCGLHPWAPHGQQDESPGPLCPQHPPCSLSAPGATRAGRAGLWVPGQEGMVVGRAFGGDGGTDRATQVRCAQTDLRGLGLAPAHPGPGFCPVH